MKVKIDYIKEKDLILQDILLMLMVYLEDYFLIELKDMV